MTKYHNKNDKSMESTKHHLNAVGCLDFICGHTFTINKLNGLHGLSQSSQLSIYMHMNVLYIELAYNEKQPERNDLFDCGNV